MRFRWTCPSRSLLIAAGATAVCCLCAAWAFQKPRSKKKKKKKPCRCTCSYADGGGRGTAVGDNEAAASAERQVGGSMMKQLVPEITTHALSYLDYTSLCCLSMTNSAMRRAANDDGVWKAPCHKVCLSLCIGNPCWDQKALTNTMLDLTGFWKNSGKRQRIEACVVVIEASGWLSRRCLQCPRRWLHHPSSSSSFGCNLGFGSKLFRRAQRGGDGFLRR